MSIGSRNGFFPALHFAVFLCGVFVPPSAWAAVAGQFSLSSGEEYNDNIFFTEEKEHDFVTYVFPTFSLLYAPPGQPAPTFLAELTPIGQIFARHASETNFGDNLRFRMASIYQYSPRLTLRAQNTLRRIGETRTGIGDLSQQGSLPGGSDPGAGMPPHPGISGLGDFISRGDELTNQFALGGRYAYSPAVSFTSDYTFDHTTFFDEGGSDLSHSAGVRAVYNWKPEHHPHAGYKITIIKSRNGDDDVVHDFDIGDDYFSSEKIELTPTLTISAAGGISFNSRSDGPRIAGRANLTLTKVWERASFNVGVRKGLTPSFGVAGVSDTTSFYSAFHMRLTEFLSASAGVDYSLYDTDDVNFNTFQALAGLQYRLTSWLTSNLGYTHRRIDSGSGAASTDLLTRGNANSNSVFLFLTARFDLWPNIGLARGPVLP